MSDTENAAQEPVVEAVALVDIDGDGTIDAIVAVEDNGDTTTFVDVDGDGTVDAIATLDENGDIVEVVEVEETTADDA